MKKIFCFILLFFIALPVFASASIGKVKELKTKNIYIHRIELQWQKITDADFYKIKVYKQKTDGKLKYKKTVKSFKISKTIKNLKAETTYYFKVRAWQDKSHGKWSSKINAKTLAEYQNNNEPAHSVVYGTLQTQNSIGRTGSYYLPSGYNTEPKPMLVVYHGTGGSGSDMVYEFDDLAAQYGFIIVAPDSRTAPDGQYAWEVGTTEGEVTEDLTHAQNCIEEVKNISGVSINSEYVMSAGHSAGGSQAPYIATNDDQFTAFAILHGGVFTEGLGDRDVKGWLSTGEEDTLRTTDMVQGYYDSLITDGFTNITYNIYSGGHLLSDQEKEELIEWWLTE